MEEEKAAEGNDSSTASESRSMTTELAIQGAAEATRQIQLQEALLRQAQAELAKQKNKAQKKQKNLKRTKRIGENSLYSNPASPNLLNPVEVQIAANPENEEFPSFSRDRQPASKSQPEEDQEEDDGTSDGDDMYANPNDATSPNLTPNSSTTAPSVM
eukprot:UN25376